MTHLQVLMEQFVQTQGQRDMSHLPLSPRFSREKTEQITQEDYANVSEKTSLLCAIESLSLQMHPPSLPFGCRGCSHSAPLPQLLSSQMLPRSAGPQAGAPGSFAVARGAVKHQSLLPFHFLPVLQAVQRLLRNSASVIPWPKLPFFQLLKLLSLFVSMVFLWPLCCCFEAFWEGSQRCIYIGYKSGNSLMVPAGPQAPHTWLP